MDEMRTRARFKLPEGYDKTNLDTFLDDLRDEGKQRMDELYLKGFHVSKIPEDELGDFFILTVTEEISKDHIEHEDKVYATLFNHMKFFYSIPGAEELDYMNTIRLTESHGIITCCGSVST